MTSRVEEAAPHAPEVGRHAGRLGRFHVTGVFWYRLHEWGMRRLPNWLKPGVTLLFTMFFFVVLRNIRGAIASNLVAVLGPCGVWERQRRIFRTMHEFAWCLTERYEHLTTDESFVVECDDMGPWDEVARSGGGFILLTAHVGNWEVGAARPTTLGVRRIHVVREQEVDPRAQAFVAELLRERFGERVTTHFATDDVRLGVGLLEALRRGDVVALQGDRPRAQGRTCEVTLFERPFHVPIGPFVLARASGVPLLPVFVLREGRLRYRTRFGNPIRVNDSSAREEDIRAAAIRTSRAIESVIRERPHQWFCFRRLWSASDPATGAPT